VIAVLDEVPYLADVDPGLLTGLQHWWDDNKHRPNLKLFLSGSYLSFMERQVLDVNAPLYNRRTGAMKLEPMDYRDAALFFPGYPPREKMTAYAVLGGLPSYLEQFDPLRSIEENVRTTVLRPNTYLSEEPDWLLRQELRRDVTYGSILRAVAKGERKPSDIARAIGRTSAQDVGLALETLRDLNLLLREVPVTEERSARSRNSLYILADPYLDFYYRFVDANRGLVERGLGDRVWERIIAPDLQHYVSYPVFERACRQFLWRTLEAGGLPDGVSRIGRWWGAGDREIDVVAVDDRDRVLLVGSCKWTEGRMDVGHYADLRGDLERSGLRTREEAELDCFLFSRSGFTDRLLHLAEARGNATLHLIDLEAMYRTSPEVRGDTG
jgi:AAA+ ATPase superfamily predicted ATPase